MICKCSSCKKDIHSETDNIRVIILECLESHVLCDKCYFKLKSMFFDNTDLDDNNKAWINKLS